MLDIVFQGLRGRRHAIYAIHTRARIDQLDELAIVALMTGGQVLPAIQGAKPLTPTGYQETEEYVEDGDDVETIVRYEVDLPDNERYEGNGKE